MPDEEPCLPSQADACSDHGMTVIEATGQCWKLRIGLSLIVLGSLGVLAAAGNEGVQSHDLAFLVMLFGGFSTATVGAVLMLRIVCPVCECAFVWREAKTLEFNAWLKHGFQATCCPQCGARSDDLLARARPPYR